MLAYVGPMLTHVEPSWELCWVHIWAIYVETILRCQFFRPGPAAATAAAGAAAAAEPPKRTPKHHATEGRSDLQKHAAPGLDVPSGSSACVQQARQAQSAWLCGACEAPTHTT